MPATLDTNINSAVEQHAEIMNAHPLQNVSVKSSEIILFTTQLSIMLDSGVVLSDAIDVISGQFQHSVFGQVISDIGKRIKGGDNFSNALSAYPKIFNPMFLSMVKASEASGKMPRMLEVVGGYLDFESETKKKIKVAMTYPIVMILMALFSTGILMYFVLPRFMKIYAAKGTQLPKITQVMVAISNALRNPSSLATIITTVVLLGVGFYWWIKTPTGKKRMDLIKVRMPVLGTLVTDGVIMRSTRIMATMVQTGVSILDTIKVVRNSTNNWYFQRLWDDTDDKIRIGYQVSEAMSIAECNELLDPGIIQMLQAGEKSGRIGEVCDKLSDFYEKKFQNEIKSLITLIEPVMLVVLGSIIGTITIALLLPVFKISSLVGH